MAARLPAEGVDAEFLPLRATLTGWNVVVWLNSFP